MTTSTSPIGRPTARDLLVRAGGDEHAEHSVATKQKTLRGVIKFICTCGDEFEVASTSENKDALRNVAEAAS